MKRRKFSPTMSLLLAIFAASLIFASSALATGQTEVVLYSFGASGSSDGQNPFAGLIADKAGNFYGTTQSGGSFGGGTVFQLSPPLTKGGAWTETVLYSFGAGGKYDGGGPEADLILDKAGNLYGTTQYGGLSTVNCLSCGTAFELTPPAISGGTWVETVIHQFGQGVDGYYPKGGLVFDAKGNLYGTTGSGGSAFCSEAHFPGCGTVFMLAPPATQGGPWIETLLHSFAGGTDGIQPEFADLVLKGGALYGVTNGGGSDPYGGTVFKLTPPTTEGGAWTEQIVHTFTGGSDGTAPAASLIFDKAGNAYGTTIGGGLYSAGTVFQLKPQGGDWSETVIYNFTGGNDGSGPTSSLFRDAEGNLYGTTFGYYAVSDGAIFQLKPPTSLGGTWTETTLFQFTGSNGANPIGRILGKGGRLYGATDSGGSYGNGTVFSFKP